MFLQVVATKAELAAKSEENSLNVHGADEPVLIGRVAAVLADISRSQFDYILTRFRQLTEKPTRKGTHDEFPSEEQELAPAHRSIILAPSHPRTLAPHPRTLLANQCAFINVPTLPAEGTDGCLEAIKVQKRLGRLQRGPRAPAAREAQLAKALVEAHDKAASVLTFVSDAKAKDCFKQLFPEQRAPPVWKVASLVPCVPPISNVAVLSYSTGSGSTSSR